MSPATAGRNTFLQRLVGAAALDAAVYEEIEADRTALTQAFAADTAQPLPVPPTPRQMYKVLMRLPN